MAGVDRSHRWTRNGKRPSEGGSSRWVIGGESSAKSAKEQDQESSESDVTSEVFPGAVTAQALPQATEVEATGVAAQPAVAATTSKAAWHTAHRILNTSGYCIVP